MMTPAEDLPPDQAPKEAVSEHPKRPSHIKTSEVLQRLAEDVKGQESITVGWLVARLGTRAFGAIILLMALPNITPQIPGMSTIFGLLIMLPAVQIMVGLSQMWLPSFLARQTMPAPTVGKILEFAVPWVQRMEKLIKPRFEFLMSPPWENIVGAAVLWLGFILFLPIPGANFLPALACAFMALGMLERDGLFIMAGLGIAVASMVVLAMIIGGLWHVLDQHWHTVIDFFTRW
ncbi:MAG TPA: exopolysaccharide biosynthesis protein [Alphaproteobacteria bacterium]|nr:exopolysaccharide biosynthesis protein [Alphaproteobacteria bacterium]